MLNGGSEILREDRRQCLVILGLPNLSSYYARRRILPYIKTTLTAIAAVNCSPKVQKQTFTSAPSRLYIVSTGTKTQTFDE